MTECYYKTAISSQIKHAFFDRPCSVWQLGFTVAKRESEKKEKKKKRGESGCQQRHLENSGRKIAMQPCVCEVVRAQRPYVTEVLLQMNTQEPK